MGIAHLSTAFYQFGIDSGLPDIVIFILVAGFVFLFIIALFFSIWYLIRDYDRSTEDKIFRWNNSVITLIVCAVIIVVFVVFCCAYTDDSPDVSPSKQNINPTPTPKQNINPTPTPKQNINPTPTPKQTSVYQDKAIAISKAMDYRSAPVRDAAVSMVKSSNGGKYNVGQICDIFDYSLSHWVYVNDPKGGDYYAPASTSVKLMRGDCDDFAIMMVSLMNAIGGTARYVSVKNANGDGHAYAEVKLGTNYDKVSGLIDSISNHYSGEKIHYSFEKKSDGTKVYWLNLDWQERHAGGKFFKSVGNAFIVDSSGNYKLSERNF